MLIEQAIRLISQPPESLAYHLIVLLALQVTFSIALWQRRHQIDPTAAGRLALAAGGIFLLRLALALIQFGTAAENAAATLPPVERAIDLGTTVLLIWGILPQPQRAPRLWDSFLLLALLSIGLGYFFAVPDWAVKMERHIPYGGTNQAMLWALVQVIFLAAAAAWLLLRRPFDWGLRLLLLVPLLAGQVLHLVNYQPAPFFTAEIPAEIGDGLVPVWARLAYILAFPLLAAVAYRQNLDGLLARMRLSAESATLIEGVLGRAVAVLDGAAADDRARRGAAMAGRLTGAHFAAAARLLDDASAEAGTLRLLSAPAGDNRTEAPPWELRLSAWPAMQMALRQKEVVELLPQGIGARQLADFQRELNLPSLGPLLLVPMFAGSRPIGLLLLGEDPATEQWAGEIRSVVPPMAAYLAAVLADLDRQATSEPVARPAPAAQPLPREEIQTLRESLRAAEEAMALASAGEGGLSTEWVTRALTHYSGELEEAQRRIASLEAHLAEVLYGPLRDSVVLLSEEMRTPVTAIEAYVGVMLAESNGSLPFEHRHLLERIKNSTRRIDDLIGRLDSRLSQFNQIVENSPQADLLQSTEMVVDTFKNQLRERRLTLDLALAEGLPPLAIDPPDLFQILTFLIQILVEEVGEHGRVSIGGSLMDDYEAQRFIIIEVLGSDVHLESRLQFTAAAAEPPGPPAPERPDRDVAAWYQLIKRNNGRVWVEKQGQDSRLVILLPALKSVARQSHPS